MHCQGHQRHSSISFYNNTADHEAKQQAASVSPVFTIAQIDKPNICTLLSYLHSLFHPSGFPGGSEVKASACNVGDLGSIPGSGRSPGEGNGNSLQYSCLENPMDRGAWWATVHGVAKSQTRLSDFTSLHFTFHPSAKVLKAFLQNFIELTKDDVIYLNNLTQTCAICQQTNSNSNIRPPLPGSSPS